MLCGADFADLGKRWRCVAFRVEFACKTAQKSRVGFHGAASCPASLHAPAAPAASCPASPPTPAAPVVSLAPRQLACRAPIALAALAAPGAPSLIRLPPRTPKAGVKQDCNRLTEWGRLALENRGGPAAAVPVGSRHKSHVMRRWTQGWDAYSTERSPAQLNAKVVLEPPFGAATLPIMNRRGCIGAARKGCSCVFSNPGWG